MTQVNVIAQEKMKKAKIPFGEAFTLSSNESSTIGNQDEYLEIKITDFIEEWGYDGPPGDKDRNYFSNVEYSLRVEVESIVEVFSFYSSEIGNDNDFVKSIGAYKILMLSDEYKNSSASIEMVVNKSEGD
ncbi:MAG: hypothetical protein AAF363_03465 [Bacteroidota bacterium]